MEVWFYRRMLRIPWTARRTNEEVLQRMGVGRELMTLIMKRQLGFLGHLLRGEGMERECLLGMVEGTRARGRQRRKYMDGIKEVIGCETVGEVLRRAEDRSVWRSIAANINLDTALRYGKVRSCLQVIPVNRGYAYPPADKLIRPVYTGG